MRGEKTWMKQRAFLTGGFFFTCIVGTLLHFAYEWSGRHILVGLIVPIGESTWEHLKMVFFPTVLWMLGGQVLLRKTSPGILAACAAGVCAGMLTVVTFFYTYTGILGKNWLPMDVFTFYLGVFVTFYTAGKRLGGHVGEKCRNGWAVLVLCALALCFFGFSFRAPSIGLFREPTVEAASLFGLFPVSCGPLAFVLFRTLSVFPADFPAP